MNTNRLAQLLFSGHSMKVKEKVLKKLAKELNVPIVALKKY